MSDNNNQEAILLVSRDTRSNSKAYVHIPPRVDQEYYQVELPYIYHGPIPKEGNYPIFIS